MREAPCGHFFQECEPRGLRRGFRIDRLFSWLRGGTAWR
jgi:hypothetical protein